jgi:hypothetical protein
MDADGFNTVHRIAAQRATTLPVAEKQRYIAIMDERAEKEELIGLLAGEFADKAHQADPNANIRYDSLHEKMAGQVEKMPPEKQKSELKRLREKFKATLAARAKELEEEGMDDEEEPVEPAAGDGLGGETAPAAAVSAGDGLDDGLGGSAAVPTPVSAAVDGGASPAAEGEETSTGTAVFLGVGAILLLIFFGGIKSFLFMLGALFLAYRTAAGSTWD